MTKQKRSRKLVTVLDNEPLIIELLTEAFAKEGTLWYYREMVKAFRSAKYAAADKGLTPLFEEVARVVSDLDSFAGA